MIDDPETTRRINTLRAAMWGRGADVPEISKPGPFQPVFVFIGFLAAGTVLIAGILFAHDIAVSIFPGW